MPLTQPFVPVHEPNDLWCIDFKGWFRTADGQRCNPLVLGLDPRITDADSRFLIDCRIAKEQLTRIEQTEKTVSHVAWSNMFLIGVLDILGTLGLGVLLAVLIDRQVRFEGAFRTVFLYPLSISFIVTGLTWQWVLSPTIGFQNFVRGLGWSDFVFA
jgi:ABC-type sugar transport system permease subunit